MRIQQGALIEAMASGCFCLSHFWDGAEEVLPEGSLYATDAELEHKILEHCGQSDAERRSRTERMRAIACEKFDIEDTKQRIRSILEELTPG